MADEFTYSGDPSKSNRDMVRFKVGDIVESKYLLRDAEIDAILSEKNNDINRTCAALCFQLANRFAREGFTKTTMSTVDGRRLSEKWQQRGEYFLRKAIGSTGFRMPALSVDTKEDHEDDTDIPQPAFKRGMMENATDSDVHDLTLDD